MEKLDTVIAQRVMPFLSLWVFFSGEFYHKSIYHFLTDFISADTSRQSESLLAQIVRRVIQRFVVFRLVLVLLWSN